MGVTAEGSIKTSQNLGSMLITWMTVKLHTDHPNNPFSERNPQMAIPMAKVDLGITRNVLDMMKAASRVENATNIENVERSGELQTHTPHPTITVPSHILFQSNHQITLLPLLFA